MTNHFGRAVGVSIVGLGLLALVISAPAGDQPYPAEAAATKPDYTDPGDRVAEQLRGMTGDRIPAASTGGAEAVVERWGETARRTALAVVEKYGQADEVSDGQLVWHNTGAFTKTIVYKEEIPHNFPAPHADVIEQFVELPVPVEKYTELARFDGSLHADRTTGLLSARHQSERDNILALNLAAEIVQGKRTAASARKVAAKAHALASSGKVSPYTQALLFKPRGGSPDPDRPDRSASK